MGIDAGFSESQTAQAPKTLAGILTMTTNRLITLTFSFLFLFQTKGQTFIDSLFLNIPLDLNISDTYRLLSSNKTFTIVDLDTSGRNTDDFFDHTSFRTKQNYFLSTGADTYWYQKGLPSSKKCDACLKWSSSISYEYSSTTNRDKYYENLIKVFKDRFPDSKVTDSKFLTYIGKDFQIKYKGNDYKILISYAKFIPEDKAISIWIN